MVVSGAGAERRTSSPRCHPPWPGAGGPAGPVLPSSTWVAFGARVDLAANKALFVVRRVVVAGPGTRNPDHEAGLLHQAEVELGQHDAHQLSETRPERLVLAALSDADIVRANPDGGEHFTGKIEGPRVDCIIGTMGSRATRSYGWDLSQDIGQPSRRSDGADQATLRLVNAPTDAVTGHSLVGPCNGLPSGCNRIWSRRVPRRRPRGRPLGDDQGHRVARRAGFGYLRRKAGLG